MEVLRILHKPSCKRLHASFLYWLMAWLLMVTICSLTTAAKADMLFLSFPSCAKALPGQRDDCWGKVCLMLYLVRPWRRSHVHVDASFTGYSIATCCQELSSEEELCSPQVLVLGGKSQAYGLYDHKPPLHFFHPLVTSAGGQLCHHEVSFPCKTFAVWICVTYSKF